MACPGRRGGNGEGGSSRVLLPELYLEQAEMDSNNTLSAPTTSLSTTSAGAMANAKHGIIDNLTSDCVWSEVAFRRCDGCGAGRLPCVGTVVGGGNYLHVRTRSQVGEETWKS